MSTEKPWFLVNIIGKSFFKQPHNLKKKKKGKLPPLHSFIEIQYYKENILFFSNQKKKMS